MDKKRVSVLVAGQRFTILTDEDEKYVIEIAAKIDARITSLVFSQNITRERAAVLTALDFADDNEQDKRAIAEIKEQIKDYLTQIDALSEQNIALAQKNDQLEQEITSLKAAADDQAEASKEIEALKAEIGGLREGNAALKEKGAQSEREIASLKAEADDQAEASKEIEALKAEINSLHEENAALKEKGAQSDSDQIALKEAQKKITSAENVIEGLKAKVALMEERLRKAQTANNAPAAPNGEAAPAQETITAEDDLFFDTQEEPAVKPQKEKKNRHDHSHVNPYRQQHMLKKNEQKGYTQQRQYSLFDTDE